MQGIPHTFNDKPRRFVWEYRSAQGEPLGYVARFDADGKKDVVPYFKRMNGHGWQSGSAAEPRPLFGLDVLAQADIARAVFIVEGEKAAAALQSLGLVAVTSQGGSKAAAKTDWTPLEGRGRVYLLPDNDAPGEAYAEAIASILKGFSKPPNVQIVRLPDLPTGGDVADWISARIPQWDGFEPVQESETDTAALLAEFQAVVKAHSEPVPAGWLEATAAATDWQAPISLQSATLPPWPDDVFPPPIQAFVSGLSVSTETPPELSALMVLAALSAAAQGKYRLLDRLGQGAGDLIAPQAILAGLLFITRATTSQFGIILLINCLRVETTPLKRLLCTSHTMPKRGRLPLTKGGKGLGASTRGI